MKNSVHRSDSQLATVAATSESWSRSSAGRRNAKPVAVISRPLRLSGRRCQAISPQAAKEPPISRRITSIGFDRRAAEHDRREHGQPRPPRRRPTARAGRRAGGSGAAKRSTASAPAPLRGRATVSPAIARPPIRREGPPTGGRSGCRPTVDRAKAGPEARRTRPGRAVRRSAGGPLPLPLGDRGRRRHPPGLRGRARPHRGRGRTRAHRRASPCARASAPVKPSAP